VSFDVMFVRLSDRPEAVKYPESVVTGVP